jgi:ATP-dependent helicase/DNAse subunit B
MLAQLRERTWSASSLELWIACPCKWFIERLLRPGRVEPDPEPLVRGGLAHAVLRETLAKLREQTGSARLQPASLDRALALLAAALARHEPDFPLSDRAERLPGARRRLAADLERYLRHAAGRRSPLEPAHLELAFGFEEGGEGLPALDLGGGLRLRGRIDRIDLAPGGEAVVYDYKGANVSPGARWIEDGKIQLALYMRAAEELLGAHVIGGFYQPLAGADLRARGVLDATAGVELECVQTDRVDRAELRALIDRAIALAHEAASEAVAGEIRPRPDSCAYPRGCAYPAICRCGR